MPSATAPSTPSAMKNGKRGLGSLILASKTFFAAARSALCPRAASLCAVVGRWRTGEAGCGDASTLSSVSSRGASRGRLTGDRSSVAISSDCEISGSSSRVRTCGVPLARASSESRRSGGVLGALGAAVSSASARRCASSFAFSAFFSASRSRLISISRHDHRRVTGGVRLGEEILVWQLIAEGGEFPLETGVAHDRGTQEDYELRLLVLVAALLEQVAEEWNPVDTGNRVLRGRARVLHQSAEHRNLAALHAQER